MLYVCTDQRGQKTTDGACAAVRLFVAGTEKEKRKCGEFTGIFSPLTDDCELYDLLHGAGVKTIHEISRCKDYAQYQTMSEANFNLVLHPEARFAAEDFHDRLKIPYIELRRLYQIDKIASQYRALAAALGVEFEDEIPRKAAEEAVEKFREIHPDAVFAVGEWMNGDPFELALALVHYGFRVSEIYGTLSGENFVYVKQLAKISPDTKVFPIWNRPCCIMTKVSPASI